MVGHGRPLRCEQPEVFHLLRFLSSGAVPSRFSRGVSLEPLVSPRRIPLRERGTNGYEATPSMRHGTIGMSGMPDTALDTRSGEPFAHTLLRA
jgi:hypothetical protein